MFESFFNSAVVQIVSKSDWMGKFVLFGLIINSIVCVAIIILKYREFKKEREQLNSLLKKIKNAQSPEHFYNLSVEHADGLGGELLSNCTLQLKEFSNTPQNLEKIQFNLDQVVQTQVMQSEQYLPVLGVSAAVGPLMGLFGTVWGLIHSFISISMEKSADIAVVAPGIAEALITTLAGIAVAIPSLIFFHYFSNELRKLEQNLFSVEDKFLFTLNNSREIVVRTSEFKETRTVS